MTFTAFRGRPFKEEFTFKNTSGKVLTVPTGDYKVTLEHGVYVREYTDLRQTRTTIYWTMTAEETKTLEFSTMYFVLTHNGNEVARGVLRVN